MPLDSNAEIETISLRAMNIRIDLGVDHRHRENLVCTIWRRDKSIDGYRTTHAAGEAFSDLAIWKKYHFAIKEPSF